MLRRASYYGASPKESSKSTVDSRLRGSLCANDYDVKSSKAASLVRAQQCYRRALARLGPRDRAAVIGRVQKGWSYEQLRTQLHVASANTARVVTHRAIERLVGLMSAGIRD